MNINKTVTNEKLKLILEGRLDTTTAPQLEAMMKTSLNGITELELDFAGLEYSCTCRRTRPSRHRNRC
jgi:anti-sigma B factor antagonist